MMSPEKIEEAFTLFTSDLGKWIHDGGMIEVDLALLNKLCLLDQPDLDEKDIQSHFPFYFHVVETPEKVTLFNQQFIVWIVPKMTDQGPSTLVLIALLHKDQPRLEISFITRGVYNSPKYVLRVLRYYLGEVIDTEEEIASIQEKNGSEE